VDLAELRTGLTPLIWAVITGNRETLDQLIARGVNHYHFIPSIGSTLQAARFTILAVTAVLLATIGVYGVVAFPSSNARERSDSAAPSG
jgi:hypothetical protein